MLFFLLVGGVTLSACVWLIVLIHHWKPAARRRGGQWYLEAIFILAGPVSLLMVALYPSDGSFSGPFPTANRLISYLVISMLIFALIHGLRNPRQKVGGLLVAAILFYLALALSGLLGVVPSLPEAYWVTPLFVLTFLIHGGYTYRWLISISSRILRAVQILSFASILVMPSIAFNSQESRQLFGLDRLQGIVGHPNGLAAIAALCLLIDVRSGSRWKWKTLSVLSLIMAQSSTGYVVAIVGLVLLEMRYSRPLRVGIWTGGIVLSAGFLLSSTGVGLLLAAVLPEDALTLTGRTHIWAAAMHGFELGPVWGYGPEILGDDFRARFLPSFDAAAQAHNQVVQSLAGSGIVGLVTLVGLVFSLLVLALRSRRATGGLSLALLSYLILRGFTETPLVPSGVNIGTLVVVIIFGLIAIGTDDPPDSVISREIQMRNFCLSAESGSNHRILTGHVKNLSGWR